MQHILCVASKGRSKSRERKELYKADGIYPQCGERKLCQLVQDPRSRRFLIHEDEMCGEPPLNIRDRYAYKFEWWRYQHGRAFLVQLGDRRLLPVNE